MHKIGFIGCGNMGHAMLKGALASGLYHPQDVIVSAKTQATLDAVQAEFGVHVSLDNAEAAGANVVILAVKPIVYDQVISQIKGALTAETVLVSLAPGKDIAYLAAASGAEKIVRVMPNTPAAVGEGMTTLSFAEACTSQDQAAVLALTDSFGKSKVIPERLMASACAVAGCAPAYVYMFIESMADAAVHGGMPRADAYQLAAQTVAGAAKMVLETGQHPAALKDAVCSPGGTTIEGVRVLEEHGMRSAVIEALTATQNRM